MKWLTLPVLTALCVGALIGFTIWTCLHLADTGLWPWQRPAPIPCPELPYETP